MHLGFYFDQSRCIGCYTCAIACKDWHNIEEGQPSWIKITTIEQGEFPRLSMSHLFTTCFHCADPLCIKACPVNAIHKRSEDGIVVVTEEACLGGEKCGFACQKACPYNIPEFGPWLDAKMQKCDLCINRWLEKKKPICVDSCPMRALDAGPLEELKAKYGNAQKADGFVYSKKVMPSVVLKANLHARSRHHEG